MGDDRSGRRAIARTAVVHGLTFALGSFLAVPLHIYLHGYSWRGWLVFAGAMAAFGFLVGVVATLFWAVGRSAIERVTGGTAEP